MECQEPLFELKVHSREQIRLHIPEDKRKILSSQEGWLLSNKKFILVMQPRWKNRRERTHLRGEWERRMKNSRYFVRESNSSSIMTNVREKHIKEGAIRKKCLNSRH